MDSGTRRARSFSDALFGGLGTLTGLHRTILILALRRPWLIPQLLGLAWAMRRRGWYRRPPFLPLPDPGYLRWRMDTAYGDPEASPPVDEFVRYLKWSSRMRRDS